MTQPTQIEATQEQLKWECFQDTSYYDLWCVRQKRDQNFGQGFHVTSEVEASFLRDYLNATEARLQAAVEALRQIAGGNVEGLGDSLLQGNVTSAVAILQNLAQAAIAQAIRNPS